MYCNQKLSAAKIGRLYGLKHPNPKSSETLVLYYLKKFGIARRDKAEHIRKVTEETADEWARRYESGESLKRIAGHTVDTVTVWYHLKKRGVILRDKVKAQIAAVSIHPKQPFVGNDFERSYTCGLALGDFLCEMHGASVRARLGTTHPAMIELFSSLFSVHGPIYQYPKRSGLTGFEWNLDCDLDPSFSFLLEREGWRKWVAGSDDTFVSFLAGFFDADGSVFFHKKREGGGFELALSNMNGNLLIAISNRLEIMGFSPKLRLNRQRPDRGVKNGKDQIYRLSMWRHANVKRALAMLPLRNREKVMKARIAVGLPYWSNLADRMDAIEAWDSLKSSIRAERDRCIDEARVAFEARRRGGLS